MARVLVTEKIAQSGLDLLAGAGHEVDVQEGLSPEELFGTQSLLHVDLVPGPGQEVQAALGDLLRH